jgi:hypothetical protein
MGLLLYVLVVLIFVGIIAAIAYYIPFPPPLSWLKWVIPLIALLIAIFLIVPKLGIA